MSAQLDALNAEIARNTATVASAVALLKTLAANAADPAAIQSAADAVKASTDSLAAIVPPAA